MKNSLDRFADIRERSAWTACPNGELERFLCRRNKIPTGLIRSRQSKRRRRIAVVSIEKDGQVDVDDVFRMQRPTSYGISESSQTAFSKD